MQDNLAFIVFSICILMIIVLAARTSLFHDVDDMITTLKIGGHNFKYQLSPDRRMPLLVIDKEFSLRQLNPGFFNKLSKEEWQEFWDIIYGIHPLIDFKNEMLASANRQYSISEIQEALIKRYPEAFSGFNSEHWKIFWSEIMGIYDYKLPVSGDNEWMQKQKDRAGRKLDRKIKQDDEKIFSTTESIRETIGE